MKRVLDTILALSKSKKKQLYKYFNNLDEFVNKASEDLYDETNGLAKIAVTTKDKTYTSEEKNTVRKDLGLPYSEEIVLAEWDGNTEGLETVTQGGLTFYKIGNGTALSDFILIDKNGYEYNNFSSYETMFGFSLAIMNGQFTPYYKTYVVSAMVSGAYPISSGGYMPPSGSYTFNSGLWVTEDFRKLFRVVYGNKLGPEYIGILNNTNIPILDKAKLANAPVTKNLPFSYGFDYADSTKWGTVDNPVSKTKDQLDANYYGLFDNLKSIILEEGNYDEIGKLFINKIEQSEISTPTQYKKYSIILIDVDDSGTNWKIIKYIINYNYIYSNPETSTVSFAYNLIEIAPA